MNRRERLRPKATDLDTGVNGLNNFTPQKTEWAGDLRNGASACWFGSGIGGSNNRPSCYVHSLSFSACFTEMSRTEDELARQRALRATGWAIEAAKSTVSPEEATEHLIAAAQHLAFVMQRLIDERKKSQVGERAG